MPNTAHKVIAAICIANDVRKLNTANKSKAPKISTGFSCKLGCMNKSIVYGNANIPSRICQRSNPHIRAKIVAFRYNASNTITALNK